MMRLCMKTVKKQLYNKKTLLWFHTALTLINYYSKWMHFPERAGICSPPFLCSATWLICIKRSQHRTQVSDTTYSETGNKRNTKHFATFYLFACVEVNEIASYSDLHNVREHVTRAHGRVNEHAWAVKAPLLQFPVFLITPPHMVRTARYT